MLNRSALVYIISPAEEHQIRLNSAFSRIYYYLSLLAEHLCFYSSVLWFTLLYPRFITAVCNSPPGQMSWYKSLSWNPFSSLIPLHKNTTPQQSPQRRRARPNPYKQRLGEISSDILQMLRYWPHPDPSPDPDPDPDPGPDPGPGLETGTVAPWAPSSSSIHHSYTKISLNHGDEKQEESLGCRWDKK